jgi:hypothetical protein
MITQPINKFPAIYGTQNSLPCSEDLTLGPILGQINPFCTLLSYFFQSSNAGCFTTLGHNCRRWFPRPSWSKKFIQTCVRFWTVSDLWPLFHSRTRPRVNRICQQSVLVISTLERLIIVRGERRGGLGSQPSGSLCCRRRWNFRKSALSTDKCKLKAISQK